MLARERLKRLFTRMLRRLIDEAYRGGVDARDIEEVLRKALAGEV